jgi:chromosome segregation protein
MKLKKVKIFGFKTFADKTELELDGNVIAVVGPNGCGKSNIVDSILWGLGETSPKHIRAGANQEVIFAGSSRRKPVGFSEVTLLFDNEDGSLPIESPEVAITRRLTRAGESTYQINRRNCRLRDIADLLADSGLGRAGYAIVGQSDIDQALAANPIQRRGWIDEAAGVQRYRSRRVEALRRLESATAHLERIADIMNEIQAQREPLEEEAELAKRYKAAANSLREVELGLLAKELFDAVKELEDVEARAQSAISLSLKETQRAQALDQESKEAIAKAQELETRIELLREYRHQEQSALEQANAAFQIAESKLQNLDTLESRMTEEAEVAEERMTHAETDFAEAQGIEAKEREALELLRASLSEADSESKKLADDLRAAETELRQARETVEERQRGEVEAAHRRQRSKDVKVELEGVQDSLPDLEEGVKEAQYNFDEFEAAVLEARKAITAARAELQQMQAEREQSASKTRKLLAEIAALDGRRRGIEATIDAHEGLTQGARAVLLAVEQGILTGEYIPVGEAVDVEPDLAQAIETALGNAANDLIVPDDAHAKRAIEILRNNRLGRATFQPLTLMRPQHGNDDLSRLLKEKGVIGLASELVSCDHAHRPVIDSLLGRVVVTDTIDDALRLAKTRGWSRMVTMDGEVVHSSGAVTGGASKSQTSGMVQRRAELHEIAADLRDLQTQLDRVTKLEDNFEGERQRITAAIEAAQKDADARQIEADEAKAWLLSLQHELTATQRSGQKLEAELKALGELASEAAPKIDLRKLEAQRDEIMKALAGRSSDADQSGARLEEADRRLGDAEARRKEAERRLHALVEAEDLRLRRSENLEPERERCRVQMAQSSQERTRFSAILEERMTELNLAIEAKKLLNAEAVELADQSRQAQRTAADCSDQAHRAEVARARADSRRATTSQRLLEEYGVSTDEAMAMAPTIELPPDAVSVTSKLRRELKSMGDVNLGAIEAFERLTERWTELNVQTDDILRGKVEIEAGVKELDRLTRDRFLTTFTRLQDAFGSLYQRMFNGGEGHLELIDPENVLDSGVEISVTIPGKRRQRLELLSGGERALSALAFLFALLKVKPSPLVILDEVDAPLDGRNVERFIAMMREFTTESQFIVITHNPTTIESADVWFGVTMQEPGVSTVVQYKVPVEDPVPALSA